MGTSCSSLTGTDYYASYDTWGNMVTRTANAVTSTLSFDTLDHLTQWSASSSDQSQDAYDASGSRVLQRSTTSAGTSITVYAFGLEEHVYDGSGNHQSDTFYYALNSRLLGTLTSTGTQFFLTDALGSVLSTISAVASSAAVLGNQLYGPYGNLRYSAGTMGTNKGFTGQYNDTVSGLDYYNARYYDPVVGRFISVDTVEGNQQGMDPYAYVSGNPETETDPTGHFAWAIPIIEADASFVVEVVVPAFAPVAAAVLAPEVLVPVAVVLAIALVYQAYQAHQRDQVIPASRPATQTVVPPLQPRPATNLPPPALAHPPTAPLHPPTPAGPGTTAVNLGGNTILTTNTNNVAKSWIQRSALNDARKEIGADGVKRFTDAMKNGIVPPKGYQGITHLTDSPDGFDWELKVLAKQYANWRFYGNFDKATQHIIFTKFGPAKH